MKRKVLILFLALSTLSLAKVEKYHLELPEKEMIVTQETEHIKFFALIDRRDLSKGESADIVEGTYKGYVPIIISEYSKEI